MLQDRRPTPSEGVDCFEGGRCPTPAAPTAQTTTGGSGPNFAPPPVFTPGGQQPSSGVGIGGGLLPGAGDTTTAPTTQPTVIVGTSSNFATPSAASVEVSSSSKGSNLSGGAVAGVAIGALIIGAALAFLAAFFLFKKRNNKSRDGTVGYNYTDSTPELVMMQQKTAGRNSPYVQVSQTPLPAPTPQQQQPDVLASILPPAAPESEIQGRITALFAQIHRHVETYYRDVHASITPSMEPELIRFGAETVNMADLLQSCSSPTTALKHALVVYILGITGPKDGSDGGETLFPESLHSMGQQGTDSLTKARTLHRRLSVLLYTASTPTRRSWAANADMREAAEHFSLTFFPWANPAADDQDKDDGLTRVIGEALELRVWLFGQPSEYEWRWDGVGSRGVVVSPQVMRVDGSGERGRVVVESVVVAV